MTLNWADLAVLLAVVVAGCGVGYFLLLSRLRRMLAKNQREMEHRLAALTEAVLAGTPTLQESATDALTAAEIDLDTVTVHAATQDPQASGEHTQVIEQQEAISPEIQAAIAAAAVAALGNHARVRSARQVPSSDVVSPWTQQGRVIVQSSHNLRTQGSR